MLTELIKEQAMQCAVMTGAGITVMILYQLFTCFCHMVKAGPRAAAVMEVIFWCGAAFVAYRFLYYCAFGRLSFHSAAAFTAGVLLWKKFIYDIIDKIYTQLYMKQGKCRKNGEKEKKQPIQREQSGYRH